MRIRRATLLVALGLLATAALPVPAVAAFGFLPGDEGFEVAAANRDGSPATQAGAHPYSLRVHLGFQSDGSFADGDLRDLRLELPPGLLVNPTSVAECPAAQFGTPRKSPYEASQSGESCPNASQVGVVALRTGLGGGTTRHFGLFNLTAPYGSPGAIGFAPYGEPVVLTPRVREADAGLTFVLEDLPQGFDVQSLDITIWGTPWDLDHDAERGNCLNEADPGAHHGDHATLPGSGSPLFIPGTCTVLGSLQALSELSKSFLTLPTTPCGAPLFWSVAASSWQGGPATAATASHDGAEPVLLSGCNKHLTIPKLQLTTDQAAVGTGLVFNLDVNDGGGILNPGGIARPAIRTAVVSLPEGLTINPSVGAGLGTCTAAEFARETASSAPGAGCPNASKVGEISVDGMLGLPDRLEGSLFVAKPYENPFGTLLSLYMVASSPRRGLVAKSVGKVVPDPRTGQLVATFEDLPRLLYTHFRLSFREGQRAVLVSPPRCGSYATDAALSSWAQPDLFDHDSTSRFLITRGRGGGPCPGGTAPFAPDLEAGSVNSYAGAYTPFHLHMTRSDADQEITSYSAKLPPGLLGKLAGVSQCPDAAIDAARRRSASAEEASPACPASSRIGRTLAGYGVGQTLAYASGGIYLAGPYRGAPLSTVAVTAARVGPFELGTVVVRSAIRIDPRSAQASIDARGSDPIPHMLEGIPLHLRDIRVYVDRPSFTLNPTSCDPTATVSTLTGAGADLAGSGDDVAAEATDRFQLSDCAAREFAPRFGLYLKGRPRRGGYPTLRAVYRPRPENANVARAAVTLPPALFLAQEHIGTICTQAQFDADRCPARSAYGKARAFTPLLDQPLEGPVYLRSSKNPLPDLIVALRGPGGMEIDLVGRIDTVNQGIRASFDGLPDAPVTKFTMTMRGGRHSLLVNSENVCTAPVPVNARMSAHNNKGLILRPRLANPKCRKQGKPRRHKGGAKR